MFRRLGLLAARYPIQIILGWIVLLAAVLATAPRLSDVVSSSQASYLPGYANSQRAQALLLQGFDKTYARSTAIVVVTGPPAARNAAVADYSKYAAHHLRPAPFSVASDSLTPSLSIATLRKLPRAQ